MSDWAKREIEIACKREAPDRKDGEIVAEYDEVIKQFKRMCCYYSRDKMQKSCPMCTSYPNCNIGQCRKIAFEKPAHFAATVTRWAAEHPEPVYPTWLEYLASYCGAPRKIDFSPIEFAEEVYGVLPETYIHWLMTHRIPADIAEKLGLQPKE